MTVSVGSEVRSRPERLKARERQGAEPNPVRRPKGAASPRGCGRFSARRAPVPRPWKPRASRARGPIASHRRGLWSPKSPGTGPSPGGAEAASVVSSPVASRPSDGIGRAAGRGCLDLHFGLVAAATEHPAAARTGGQRHEAEEKDPHGSCPDPKRIRRPLQPGSTGGHTHACRRAIVALTVRRMDKTAHLIDPFQRAISYLRVSVTDRCDFRCVYCMAENMTFLPKKDLLTLEELEPDVFHLRGASAWKSCASPAASRWCGGTS